MAMHALAVQKAQADPSGIQPAFETLLESNVPQSELEQSQKAEQDSFSGAARRRRQREPGKIISQGFAKKKKTATHGNTDGGAEG